MNERNGKQVPEKVGLKGVTREGMDYELTIMLDVDIKHHATASKDRTGLFMDKPAFTISPETGKLIKEWCEQGIAEPRVSYQEFANKINSCESTGELKKLYLDNPKFQQSHLRLFNKKKIELEEAKTNSLSHLTSNYSSNGNGTIQQ